MGFLRFLWQSCRDGMRIDTVIPLVFGLGLAWSGTTLYWLAATRAGYEEVAAELARTRTRCLQAESEAERWRAETMAARSQVDRLRRQWMRDREEWWAVPDRIPAQRLPVR